MSRVAGELGGVLESGAEVCVKEKSSVISSKEVKTSAGAVP